MTAVSGEPEAEAEELLTVEQAVALLPDGDDIHTMVQSGGMTIGADWSRESVLELLATTSRIEVGGPNCQAMGHGLIAWRPNGRPLFIETRREEAS